MLEKAYDTYGHELNNVRPRGVSLTRSVNSSIDTSHYIKLHLDNAGVQDTEYITVYAISKDVYLKWANNDQDYCRADNFDEVIPAGEVFMFQVPAKADGTIFDGIHVVGRESGATAIVIER